MNKKVIALGLFVFSLMYVQCKKDSKITTEYPNNKVVEKKQNLVGSWSAIEVSDDIRNLAQYVIIEKNIKSSINIITKASTQIVSGKNYRFDISLNDGNKYMAQVYVDIKGNKKITTFKKIN